MRILTLDDTLPAGATTVLTVGNFDGVHRGHQFLIAETLKRASEKKAVSAVVTFDPPTRAVIQKEGSHSLLSTFEEKAVLIGLSGIDYLVKVPFNGPVNRMEPETFIREILHDGLHMTGLVTGLGHTFGRNRAGNENFLHTIEGKYHFTTFVSDLLAHEGSTISSTQIREYVMHGRIADAVVRLGRPYLISVERTRGKKLGAKLGYPTLNFRSPPSRKVIPIPGVYAAEAEFKGVCEKGALYFGECPTLHERREVHFEFHSLRRGKEEIGEGERADLWLYSFIRNDSAFEGTGALAEQIGRDIETIRIFFAKEKMQWR
jgi:riboflavin kinase/FMN adenylyltransferase